jgi:methylphosphotriester-DNA--protein-cysteine methyltransferase
MTSQPIARHLLRARDLADTRYAEPLTVADMAGAARLSPAHFSREFKRAFGESPHQYLLTRRLERAVPEERLRIVTTAGRPRRARSADRYADPSVTA